MPTINTEIFKKAFTTSPTEVSAPIYGLCRELNPNSKPTWVAVRPDPDAIVSECFSNVASKVARDGGSLLFGWTIWEWPRVFVEAEHHAIWENNGELLDVTPHASGEHRILFSPDPGRTYDFVGKKRIMNVKRSLGVFASVQRWIDASETLHRTMEANSVGNEVRMNRSQMKALWEDTRNAQARFSWIWLLVRRSTLPAFAAAERNLRNAARSS